MPVNRKLVVRILSVIAVAAMFFMNVASASEDEKVIVEKTAEQKTEQTVEQNEVVIETNKGKIIIALYPDKAPITVKNFKAYVKSGFYDDVIFHRVVSAYIIQAGGFTKGLSPRLSWANIQNESNNGLKNRLGTVAMARGSDPHSASSQFFINLQNNKNLDFKNETPQGWGFTVFGKVIFGLDVAMKISFENTRSKGPMRNIPVKDIVIKKMYLR